MNINREIELLENLIKESQEKIETLRRAAASGIPKLDWSSMLRVRDRNGASYQVACHNSGVNLSGEEGYWHDWDHVASVVGPLRYETPDEREARGAVAVPLHGVYVVCKDTLSMTNSNEVRSYADNLDSRGFSFAACLLMQIATQMEREENTDG